MTELKTRKITYIIPVVAIVMLFIFTPLLPMSISAQSSESGDSLELTDYPGGYDPSEDPLVKAGYRPMYPSPDSEFIQTPEPIPDDAVMHPYGWTPSTTSDSPTRAAEWTLYYDSNNVDVYVDTSSQGGGDLSSNEEDLLDRIISDFQNFSWPRVKDYFDPNDKVEMVDFRIHKIDGPSGTGGYYQPGTNEFHLDRDDFSWGGVIAAHEFQHYVHRQYDTYENLWVDEGCADFGAYLVYGITSAISSHIYAYLQWRPLHSIVVDDYTFYQDTTTSYYGSSFLFQLYLIEHYGGKNYTHGLVRSTLRGINGVNRGLAASGTSDRFEEAFSKFMVAIRVNDDYAGQDGEYSYSTKSYSYGSLRLPLTRSHSGSPISDSFADPPMSAYSVNSFRFSSAPERGETYRLKLTYGEGSPIASIYYETDPPRSVEHIDFGSSTSKTIDITGWGENFTSFQLITTSSVSSALHYELDVLDLIPPVSTASVSPFLPDGVDGWYVTQPQVTFKSESSAKIYYRLNGGEELRYSEPLYLSDGIWNISYNAVDRHDNVEEVKFLDFKVDSKSPTSSMVVEPDLPDDKWYTASPRITLNTAHPQTTLQYKFGNDEYTDYDEPVYPPEGISNFFWRSIDQAGNSESERSRTFKVDTIAPSMEYSIYPEQPDGEDGWYVTEPTVTLSSEDTDNLYYSFDGGVMSPYTQPISIPDGAHTLRMLPIDQAGNQGDEMRLEVKVDTVVPEIYVNFEGWEYDIDNSSKWLTFAPTLAVDGSENGMTIMYSMNEDEEEPYSKPLQIGEGENMIWVHGKDKAGNPAESQRFFIKVDLKSPFIEPVISHETVNGWYLDNDVEVVLELTGEDDRSSPVVIEYSWKGDDTETYRSPIQIPEGTNTLLYWATDLAGNRMESRSLDFRKDSTLPSIGMDLKGTENGKVDVGTEITVDLSSSNDENGIKFYSIVLSDSEEPQWSPDSEFPLKFSEPGKYNITGYVRDGAGNIREKVVSVEVTSQVEEQPGGNGDRNGDDSQVLIIMAMISLVVIVVVVAAIVIVVSKRGQKKAAPIHGHHPNRHVNHQHHHPKNVHGHNSVAKVQNNAKTPVPAPPKPPM
jgi:hypothetical protein